MTEWLLVRDQRVRGCSEENVRSHVKLIAIYQVPNVDSLSFGPKFSEDMRKMAFSDFQIVDASFGTLYTG